MANSLGKRIVAEGIEHTGSIPTLLRMADMDFHGYLLSRPLPALDVERLIPKWRSGIDMWPAFQIAGHQPPLDSLISNRFDKDRTGRLS